MKTRVLDPRHHWAAQVRQRAIEAAQADGLTEAVRLVAVRRSWLARPLSEDAALAGWHNDMMLP